MQQITAIFPGSPIKPTFWQRYPEGNITENPYLKNVSLSWDSVLHGALVGAGLTTAFLGLSERKITDFSGTVTYLSIGAAVGAAISGFDSVMAACKKQAERVPLTVAESMLESCIQINSLAEQARVIMSGREQNKYAKLGSTLELLKKEVKKTESNGEKTESAIINEHINNILVLRSKHQKELRRMQAEDGDDTELKRLKTELKAAQQECSEYLKTLERKTEESKRQLNEDIVNMEAQMAAGTTSSSPSPSPSPSSEV